MLSVYFKNSIKQFIDFLLCLQMGRHAMTRGLSFVEVQCIREVILNVFLFVQF